MSSILPVVPVIADTSFAYPRLPFLLVGARRDTRSLFFGGFPSHWALLLALRIKEYTRGDIGCGFSVLGAGFLSIYTMEGVVDRWHSNSLRIVTPERLRGEIVEAFRVIDRMKIVSATYEKALSTWRAGDARDHPEEY